MPKRTNISGLLNRLSASEEQFLDREFLAPVVRGRKVRVAIDSVRFELQTYPRNFVGWGVFRPSSHTSARLAREASLVQRRQYLDLLPLVRMILCSCERRRWLAVPSDANARVAVVGTPPIEFVQNAEQFQTVRTRFDGANFWFDGIEPTQDLTLARRLATALAVGEPPDRIHHKGLTKQHRLAYAIELRRHQCEAIVHREASAESKIRHSLEHAGGSLEGFAKHVDGYRVTWRTPAGERYVSSVDQTDLTVQVAGICLDGEDRKFDLASLVGVYEEAKRDEPWVLHD